MAKLNIILIICLCCLRLHAQEKYLEDVIYLKNGSIIRGLIIEQTPLKDFTIQSRDSIKYQFKIDEIQRIAKEVFYRDSITLITKGGTQEYVRKDKFITSYDLGFLYGRSEYVRYLKDDNVRAMSFFSISTTLHYLSSSRKMFGLNFGLDLGQYEGNIGSIINAPISIQYRQALMDSKLSPTLLLGFGQAFTFGKCITEAFTTSGFLAQVSPGLKVNLKDKINIFLDAGYRIQRGDWLLYRDNGESQYFGYYHFLYLKTGIIF